MNRKNNLKATIGKIKPGETELNVAVLEDETRVIPANAVFKTFWRVQRSNARLINMPAFLDAKNLQPFIGEDLMPLINRYNIKPLTGKRTVDSMRLSYQRYARCIWIQGLRKNEDINPYATTYNTPFKIVEL